MTVCGRETRLTRTRRSITQSVPARPRGSSRRRSICLVAHSCAATADDTAALPTILPSRRNQTCPVVPSIRSSHSTSDIRHRKVNDAAIRPTPGSQWPHPRHDVLEAASQVSRRRIQRQQRSKAQSAPKKRPFCHHGRLRSEDLRPPLPPDRRGCCRCSFSGLRIPTPRSYPAVSCFQRIVIVVSISSRLIRLPRFVPFAQ